MEAKTKHDQIVALKTAGISNRDITKQLDVCRKTVFNVWKRYTETATTSSKPIHGRKRLIRTKHIVQAVMKRVKRYPRRSMKKTASHLGIARSSMLRIFKNDLRLSAYKKQSRQLISAASKQKQHDRGKIMLAEMWRAVDHVFIWFNEKIFSLEAVTNTQNDRLYARDAGDLPEGSRNHFRRMKPAGVMVWAAVASDGSKSPLVFIEEGINVSTRVYIIMLTEKVIPCIAESFGNRYVFTEDGASSHTSNLTQQWWKDHFSGFWDKNMCFPQVQASTQCTLLTGPS
jgi:transposase